MHREDTISAHEYQRLADLIRLECGIVFPAAKRTMVESRLSRRARALGIESLSAYCQHLHSPAGRHLEVGRLIDEVTTHKTDFFREPGHFRFLVKHILPELSERTGAGLRQPLRVWSAASSTGEEPYTLAMVLSDYAQTLAERPSNGLYQPAYRFHIEATDVSQGVLEKALQAVYPEVLIAPVPLDFRKKYLLRSKDATRAVVRMTPAIRSHVSFRPLNLMDGDYGFADPLDVVFCRNVMIYFDRSTQRQVLLKILATLHTSGYLLMGHSESLNGLDLPVEQVAPTVYRRIDG
jgi:chemotaxis protein methyltransferase CheR